MKKKLIWGAGALCLLFLIAGAGFLYDRLSDGYAPDRLTQIAEGDSKEISTDRDENLSADGTEENSAAGDDSVPDFSVIDYDGEAVKLSDYFGTPIVLNFWASWCPPCKAEMPDFDKASEAHSEVCFLMVNMTDGGRETVESAKEHVESQGYGFTVLFDTEYSAAYAYGVNSLPTTFFIGSDGKLKAYANGMLDAETLEQGISMITE